MTDRWFDGRIPAMFRSKQSKQSEVAPPTEVQQLQTSSGAYQRTELPTFHGRQRKVVVYSSDANGRIIKTFKK